MTDKERGEGVVRSAGGIGVSMPVPRAYGLFHIASVALIFLVCFFFVRWLASAAVSERGFRTALFVIWLILIAFDLYKQISFDLLRKDSAGNIIADYHWYAFPFQLCSTPHYVLPFVIFMKQGRARDAFVGFLAFFSFVGGVFVLLVPETCFTDRLFVNIQTMLHHGMQVIISLLLVFRYKGRVRLRMYLDSAVVFSVLVSLALILNVSLNVTFGESVHGFNMFYIGPFHLELMPALSALATGLPYPVYLFGYMATLSLAAFLSYLLLRAVSRPGHSGRVTPV